MSTKTKKSLQPSTRLFDLVPLENFSGLNLPTNGDVLRRFFSIKDKSEKNIKNSIIANQIYNELKGLYNKVPVTMKKDIFCVSKICKENKFSVKQVTSHDSRL